MNRLKELRKEKKLTQEELAGKIGVSKITILRWENEKHVIKSDKAQSLADYFGVSVPYLLDFEQRIINDNEFLRDENTRLNKEFSELNHAVAKANLLDVIIEEGYILPSTLDKCIAKLDEIDQKELKTWKN
ncbi:helix-turn-helix domain-containing protein [Streptococcus dysgalactiae subsp. dysgalactiae]|nr:helix-turn-helix domain-containing protein [Streptococcus dysgalactiae subsp. dysgalactiae]